MFEFDTLWVFYKPSVQDDLLIVKALYICADVSEDTNVVDSVNVGYNITVYYRSIKYRNFHGRMG